MEVHSGAKIEIWNSTWLPDQNGGRVWSPKSVESEFTMVSKLLDSEKRE